MINYCEIFIVRLQ